VQSAAGSSELDAKVKELSNAMRASLTDFETKVGELNARFDQLQSLTNRVHSQMNLPSWTTT
jgi:outer membrane murein-binding lipoprotein Lpp